MSLHEDIDVYLTQRRARGFKLKTTEPLLRQFCGWLQAHGKTEAFTIDDAVQWACDRPGAAPVWQSQRLTAVRPFAAWLNARDALEHRLAVHVHSAAAACASLADKHVTMHTLRHTAAMNLLAEGVDISVIALWLGHQRTQSTDAYLHADMAIKQAAIDRTRPPNTEPGTYRPEPDILTWLANL